MKSRDCPLFVTLMPVSGHFPVMANAFYDPGDQRAAKVNHLFATIASRYDFINDLQSFGLHRRWKNRLVRLAKVAPGDRALDVCCGTGDIAQRLARAGAKVTGLDFSEPMLAVARQRSADRRGHGSGPAIQELADSAVRAPEFIQGDATKLPFEVNTFDIVSVGYGLRNLTSWETGLTEMLRVTRPGGRVLVLDFGKPDNALWRWLYFTYLRLFVPVLGLVFCGNASAYAYILESLKHYPAQNGVAAKMRELGMKNVRIVNLLGGVMSINYGEKVGD
jgi:demethylmenaquinone methyltransferase/2-methoxy-6-polyprenyl-1,4-benzoquinol methylase